MAEAAGLREVLNPCLFHLQKMEVELKCPICLNLLRQPVSLPCSHIFCSSCIMNPSKSRSDCPVCKQRYSWQDVRLSPHMEQMGHIYRGMRTAFGVALLHSNSRNNHSDVLATGCGDSDLLKETCNVSPKYDSRYSQHIDNQFVTKPASYLFPSKKRVQVSPSDIETGMGTYDEYKKLLNYEEKSNGVARQNCMNIIERNIEPGLHGGSLIEAEEEITKLNEKSRSSADINLRLHSIDFQVNGNYLMGNGKESGKRLAENVGIDRVSKKQNRSYIEHENSVMRIGHDGPVNDAREAIMDLNSYCLAPNNAVSFNASPQLQTSSDVNVDRAENGTNSTISSDQCLESEPVATDAHMEIGHSEGMFHACAVSSPDEVRSVLNNVICAFCQSSGESEASGPLVHYLKGKVVAVSQRNQPDIVHAHTKCVEWAPNAYYDDDEIIQNLESEVARSVKIKCSKCGQKGAALGCYAKTCRRSYHVPCAADTPNCRWDDDDYLMFCPVHSSLRFPSERKSGRPTRMPVEPSNACSKTNQQDSRKWMALSGTSDRWMLCGSALTTAEKDIVTEFSSLTGATLSKSWDSNITHVIASVDENGCCRRTLKVLMAILNGRWIVNINWIKACREAMHPVSEEPYEVHHDIHGCSGGPRNGRLRAAAKEPPLFSGLNFFFIGEFEAPYRGYLQDLVLAAGGSVLRTLPSLEIEAQACSPPSIILVYHVARGDGVTSPDGVSVMEQAIAEATSLAATIGARVAGHEWLLDSVAACSLQPLSSAGAAYVGDAVIPT
ncbi:BRCA1-associated RING domain protein 1-like isoform X2 [Nymphaea colorata]|uniref:BRCA1-associated RING domain protein 1-like isoform X2 n=1 Tax=Nymphaea colorata TaxID=210225 RepID=UPI00129DEB1C|nr:BRCA1-associated RING domain protein 1-like isoform X2 [Nymphaea colorata]